MHVSLLVWSATRADLAQAGANPNTYLEKELLNVAIGLVLMAVVSLVDYRLLRVYTPLVYAAACLGLLVVLSPLGVTGVINPDFGIFADSTGGRAFQNTNTPWERVPEMFRDWGDDIAYSLQLGRGECAA